MIEAEHRVSNKIQIQWSTLALSLVAYLRNTRNDSEKLNKTLFLNKYQYQTHLTPIQQQNGYKLGRKKTISSFLTLTFHYSIGVTVFIWCNITCITCSFCPLSTQPDFRFDLPALTWCSHALLPECSLHFEGVLNSTPAFDE